MIEELDVVVLEHDLPAQGLKRGDIGAVVHVYAEHTAFEVEFVTADGSTIAVATLERHEIRPQNPSEILHVRDTMQSAA